MSMHRKRVLLTGGSGGIGRLLAARFVRDGADLAIMSRRDPRIVGARHLAADLSTQAGIAAAQAVVARERPDILVNLAGVQYFGLVEDQSPDELARTYLVNLVAPASLCQACLPAMKARNSGQIVNIGSVLGSIPFAHFAVYSSAKAGLHAFSQALRRELVDLAVAVTHVSPRAARTALLTPDLAAYAAATGMAIDEPDAVAAKIYAAIRRRRKDLCIGFPESVFVRLNAVWPRLVDAAVAGKDRRSKAIFAQRTN